MFYFIRDSGFVTFLSYPKLTFQSSLNAAVSLPL